MTKPSMYALPDIAKLPEALRTEVANRRSLNVYQMIMHTPAVAPAFLAMSDALRHANSLPPAWRELAILRVGQRYQAAYEIHHHERLARAAGLGEAVIAATRSGAGAAELRAEERQILQLTEELLDAHGLSEASRRSALKLLSVNQLADLVLTVGYYQLVCNFLNTFGVKVEA